MKTAICLLLVVACSGCFTPRKIDRERRVFQVQAKDNAVFAGVDVFGLSDAFKADPAGTAGAVTLDTLLGAGAALAAGFAVDQLSGSDSKAKASPSPDVPQVQADTFIYNQGNGSINYSAGNNNP